MSQSELLLTYLTAIFGRFRDDERGTMAEVIVLTGLALAASAAIGLIIWGKLKEGAGDLDMPDPAAP